MVTASKHVNATTSTTKGAANKRMAMPFKDRALMAIVALIALDSGTALALVALKHAPGHCAQAVSFETNLGPAEVSCNKMLRSIMST